MGLDLQVIENLYQQVAGAFQPDLTFILDIDPETGLRRSLRRQTEAAVRLEKVGDGFRITKMKLEVRGEVPGLDQAGFAAAAEKAKDGCPVSQALKGNVQMELDARLA